MEENLIFINVNICKKLNVLPEVFCCFLTVFDQCKKYALFRNNRIQRNIRKRNQSFGYGNCISSIFGLKTSFEMSEGGSNVPNLSRWPVLTRVKLGLARSGTGQTGSKRVNMGNTQNNRTERFCCMVIDSSADLENRS